MSPVIPTPARPDVVTTTILINGETIDSAINILGIHVERELNRLPWAIVMIRDGDAASEDFPVSNSETFVPGAEVEIKAGYRSEEETIFKGVIIKHSIRSKRNRGTVLEIECRDKAYKMALGRKNKYFQDSRDSDVIEEIVQAQGLQVRIDSTSAVHEKLVQFYCSDWDFVLSRAETNGLMLNPVDGEIRLIAPDFSQDPVLQLSYGSNIIEFEAGMDARSQYGSVKTFSWDAAEQAMAGSESMDPQVEEPGNISGETLAENAGLDVLELKHGGQPKDDELQSWSDSSITRSRLSKVRGRVSFQGFAEILPGNLVELTGMGERFNGIAFASSIRHEITRGNWVTYCGFGMPPERLRPGKEIMDVPAAGLLPAVNGLQVGVVTALAGDPDAEYRIKVTLPVISKDDEGTWARIATLDAGNQRGTFFLPEIGDEVIVGFLNDDPRDAIVLGMLHSSARPAPLEPSDDNHEKGYFSRSGIKLYFNDDTTVVTLETPRGNKLVISDDEGSVTLEDQNGNSIVMDNIGITMESVGDIILNASGDVKISGTTIEQSASSQLKAEGGGAAEFSSGGQTTIRGAIVQIN